MSDIFNMADTWNAGGTVFSAIKMDVTNTASHADAMLLDLRVGGAIQFAVDKNGNLWGATPNAIGQGSIRWTDRGPSFWSSFSANQIACVGNANVASYLAFAFRSDVAVGWATSTNPETDSMDVLLYRDGAAGILAQRVGTAAQTFRVYRTWSDASNFQRIALGWNTTTALIMNEGLGTGADGNIAFNDAALATGATKGYIMIPSCPGAPTGVPADIPTGQIALHYDSTNNQIYAYNGAWKKTVALT